VKSRIHIVDDHPIVLSGYQLVINAQSDIEVTGTSGSVAEAMTAIERTQPDLIITDLTMPGRGGLELVKDLISVWPEAKVLVISMHDEMLYAERALRAGAKGYVMKDSAATHMLGAIRQVLTGGIHVSERVSAKIIGLFAGTPGRTQASPLERLTDREFDVFRLFGEGKTTKEVASSLNLSPKTVAVHRDNIKHKLGFASSAKLMRYAVRWVESESVAQA